METSLPTLFAGWASDKAGSIVQLMNRDHVPIAALYLDKLDLDSVTICTTNTSERYYIYLGGIAIFFTYYRRVDDNGKN